MFNLCTPALIYFVISTAAIVIMALQTAVSPDFGSYCVGMYTCNPGSISAVFAMKAIYVVVWTWILQLICSKGYPMVSWLLVLFPIIIMFIMIAMVFLTGFHTGTYLPSFKGMFLF